MVGSLANTGPTDPRQKAPGGESERRKKDHDPDIHRTQRVPLRPIVTVLAVVAFVAGVYAISQQILTDTQPSAPAATEAVAETAEPYTGPSGLSEAYAAGKLDQD